MGKRTLYTCDGPECERTGKPSDFGRFGHWLTLSVPEPEMPFYNTQHGLAQERYEHHFHHPRCLLRWTEMQRGLQWTGAPDVLGKVDPEWQDVAAMREP